LKKQNKAIVAVSTVILFILIFDQVLKIWVKSSFHYTDPEIPLLGDWFVLNYVENQGMAFGTTLGAGAWAKLALSLFRVAAIGAIVYYLIKQIKANASLEFIIVVGLVLAGATGNLIDSMVYDFIFEFDPCLSFNHLEGSGNMGECEYFEGYVETVELRNTGFLYGNVVDMFQFRATWPSWVPWLGGSEVFPAIWNVADAAISVGIVMVLFRQKKYFPKDVKEKTE
jgi:signal peptidase II